MTEHFTISEDEYLKHYGILRRSGRYPWGSGGTPEQNHRSFLGMVEELKKQGLSEAQIAKSFSDDEHPFTTNDLRALKSIARNELRAANIAQAEALKAKGMSNGAIAERMGLPGESSVRALLEPGAKERANILEATTNMLKEQVAEKGFVEVGAGTEYYVLGGISRTRLDTALAALRNEGYKVINVQEDQLTTGNKTTLRVLAPPGKTEKEYYKELVQDRSKIKSLAVNTDDGGRSYTKPLPPLSVDSKRVGIQFKEDGGADADGVIYVRPGKDDLSLGGNHYAQVRIMVDNTHFMKGMAIYKDDLPDGVDLLFNTNKSRDVPVLGDKDNTVLKPIKDEEDNPFGSITRQIKSLDGEKVTSVMNIVGSRQGVGDEGSWESWSKSLASQMLSKQKPTLAKQQLEETYNRKKADFDEIMGLTNPTVRKSLLKSFSDDVDASAVELKAAALPRQATKVILPVNSLKDTEIYAPTFNDGERVALIRYPHGGTFEIPELTVNNRHPEGKRLLGQARDAVGINARVAERLSGADFDGDAVVVIPNNSGKIKSTAALEGLKNFDPKTAYPKYEGMPKMTPKQKQSEMGKISNLITDMTIKRASSDEIARAVRHSMVVIDAEKHELNYKLSAERNGIAALKAKYQGGESRGASTLISRTTSEMRVPHRKQHYRIDPETGEKVYNYTGETIPVVKKDRKTGEKIYTDKTRPRTTSSTKGAEAKDANLLTSAYDSKGNKVGPSTVIEQVYADHANRLKAMANSARKEMVSTRPIPMSPSAKKVYANEVASLKAKLNVALKNAPLERQAQVVANAVVKAKREANPHMDSDELKKLKARELINARTRVGARKTLVDITDTEWEAIQAGAISNNQLEKILINSDPERVKQLATPRQSTSMPQGKVFRAQQLHDAGKTLSEISTILGVPMSTLQKTMAENSEGS